VFDSVWLVLWFVGVVGHIGASGKHIVAESEGIPIILLPNCRRFGVRLLFTAETMVSLVVLGIVHLPLAFFVGRWPDFAPLIHLCKFQFVFYPFF